MKKSLILSAACTLMLSAPAFAQDTTSPDVSGDEIDCALPENAELEECLVLLPADDITNFIAIGAGAAGILGVAAAAGGGGSSGTTGTTGTTN